MRVKVVWPTGVWLNGEKVGNWQEAEIDETLARELESKKMVVLMDAAPAPKGRRREPHSDS